MTVAILSQKWWICVFVLLVSFRVLMCIRIIPDYLLNPKKFVPVPVLSGGPMALVWHYEASPFLSFWLPPVDSSIAA